MSESAVLPSARLCENDTLGTAYKRYIFDNRRNCLTSKLHTGPFVEGAVCHPGLANTEGEYLANFFRMLVHIARYEECDREQKRHTTLQEAQEHARLLSDRTASQRLMTQTILQYARLAIGVVAAALTASPIIYIYVCVRVLFVPPSLLHFSAIACASSMLLLLTAVFQQKLRDRTLIKVKHYDAMDLVVSDVIESKDLETLRKRVSSHLHRGNIHAAFELNRPKTWAHSRHILVLTAAVACVWAVGASASHLGVTRALSDTFGATRGGGLSDHLRALTLRTAMTSFIMLAASMYATAVAWNDMIA